MGSIVYIIIFDDGAIHFIAVGMHSGHLPLILSVLGELFDVGGVLAEHRGHDGDTLAPTRLDEARLGDVLTPWVLAENPRVARRCRPLKDWLESDWRCRDDAYATAVKSTLGCWGGEDVEAPDEPLGEAAPGVNTNLGRASAGVEAGETVGFYYDVYPISQEAAVVAFTRFVCGDIDNGGLTAGNGADASELAARLIGERGARPNPGHVHATKYRIAYAKPDEADRELWLERGLASALEEVGEGGALVAFCDDRLSDDAAQRRRVFNSLRVQKASLVLFNEGIDTTDNRARLDSLCGSVLDLLTPADEQPKWRPAAPRPSSPPPPRPSVPPFYVGDVIPNPNRVGDFSAPPTEAQKKAARKHRMTVTSTTGPTPKKRPRGPEES